MKNIIVYDLEIIKAIPTKEPRIEGIEYCKGWQDFEGMGISVVAYKWNNEPAQFAKSAIDFMGVLISYDDEDYSLVGFNSRSFDDKLLAVNGLEGIFTKYDLLEQIRFSAGFSAGFRSVPKGYSYKLDAIAQANGMAKTGHGSLAPVLWQQGKYQEVIDYAKMDVDITASILSLGLDGKLIDPNTGNYLSLRPIDDEKTNI